MIGIGKKAAAKDPVGRLRECHEKLRKFSATAVRLAGAEGASVDDVREAASGVVKYFTQALPRHTADEDESLLPRLMGLDPDVDEELIEMEREHREHEGAIGELITLCRALADAPDRLGTLRTDLQRVAAKVDAELGVHLAREESVIFPAVERLLGDSAREEIGEEMTARRSR